MSEPTTTPEDTATPAPVEDSAQGATATPMFVVDWARAPQTLYANAMSLDMASDGVNLVFLELSQLANKVRIVDGRRVFPARPVASIQMTHPNFFHILQEMVRRWDEFADAQRAAGADAPKFFDSEPSEQKEGA